MENFLKNNWFKIIIAVIILIIAIPAGYYYVVIQTHQQEQKNKIDLQNKCSAQAKKVFDAIQGSVSDTNYTYKNHYIGSLSRCYVLIHGIGVAGIGTSDKLIDAYKNEVVADCESYGTAPELNFCAYNGSGGMKYDINQFNDFIKPYMEAE